MGNKFLKNIKVCKRCGRFYKKKCKCSPVWNRGLSKETSEPVRKQAAQMIGKNNPMYGKVREKSPTWNGGSHNDGYLYVLVASHPRAKKISLNASGKYIPQHVLVMEEYLGRYLNKGEVVHHIDEDRSNNSIENLRLFKNNGDHIRYHLEEKRKCRRL